MANEDTLTKLVNKILSTCKEEYKILESFIDNIEEFTLPTYNQLKDPEFFLDTHSNYVEISTTTHFHKIKIGKIMIDITSMINELSKYKLTSITQKSLNDLKIARDKCKQYVDTLEEYQKSLNQILDYLKMYSYTVNTPYNV